MDTKISVIVGIYKTEKLLSRCIESILDQTYRNLEIILIEDGSPDRCGQICEHYRSLDQRIKVVHKRNGGISEVRNIGVELATGEYIAFVDSDDFIHNTYIEKLYMLCKKYNAQIAQCGFAKVTDTKGKPKMIDNSYEEIKIYSNKEMLYNLFNENYVCSVVVWSKLYHKHIFRNIRFPVGRLHEDEAVIHKLFYESNRIAVTREPLYYYCISGESITRSAYSPNKIDIIQAYEERLVFFTDIAMPDLYRYTLYRYFYHLVSNYCLYQKHCKDLVPERMELREKIRRTYDEIRKGRYFSTRARIKMSMVHIFPGIYGRIWMNKG